MLEAILTGLIAALVVLLSSYFQGFFQGFFQSYPQGYFQDGVSSVSRILPIFIMGIGTWNVFFDQFLMRRKSRVNSGGLGGERYDGLADFLIYIHSPVDSVSFLRWTRRTLNSFLWVVAGGPVGTEGAAIEAVQTIRVAMKIRSARWFEQRRRTEVSMGMAGGISAAFQAPFAGMLLPIELGLGGRSLFAVVSALTAFLTVRIAGSFLHVSDLYGSGLYGSAWSGKPSSGSVAVSGFSFTDWQTWLEFALIGVLAALMGWVLVRFILFIRNEFLNIFKSFAVIGSMVAAGLLVMIYLIYPAGHQPPWILLENVLRAKYSLSEVGFLFSLQLLSLSIILAGFGTLGVFWPIFMLGGMVGFGFHEQFFQSSLFNVNLSNGNLLQGSLFQGNLISGAPLLGAAAGLVGSSAFLGVIFGAPVTGAVLVYEITHDFNLLLPCLMAGVIAQQVSRALKVPRLLNLWLEARGHSLLEGRSADILSTIKVEQAMVKDYQTVSEHEPLSVLRGKILESRYPFLPVVNARAEFVGLLTIDMIQEGWKEQTASGNRSLSSLLEAKDLLYRARTPSLTLRQGDTLSMAQGLFDELPCVPVLSNEGRIVGLLFTHNVRMAYDREAIFRKL